MYDDNKGLTSSIFLHAGDEVLVLFAVGLVRLGFDRHVQIKFQIQKYPLREKVVGSVVLPQVVEDHHRPSGPVEVGMKHARELSQFGGRRSGAHDRPVLFPLVEPERRASGRYQRQVPVRREPPHRGEGVHAPRSDEHIGSDVKFGVHGDYLRFALHAGARRRVLRAEVEDVHGAAHEEPVLLLEVLTCHENRRENSGQSPGVFLIIVWKHHGYGYVICPGWCSTSCER